MNAERDNELPKMSSVLGENAVVVGNATGKGDLEIRGRVQGDVLLQGRALVAEGGIVLGRIEAIDIVVAGQVRGDLNAIEGIVIHPTGDVEGNIDAPRVTILAGARVRGSLRAGESQPRTNDVYPAQRSTSSATTAPLEVLLPPRTRSEIVAPKANENLAAPVLPSDASDFESHPSRAAELPRPRTKGRPKAVPSFQKGARAELKDAE